MSLRKLLKNFCIDAYHELRNMGEFPRPFYDTPIIADNIIFTHPLSQLTSYIKLQKYMRSSGLAERLRDIGHTWLWHKEVFEWLFLERFIDTSMGKPELFEAAFNKVYSRAWAEIQRSSFHIRRVTVLNSLPRLNRPIKLCANVLITPVDFSNSHIELLRWIGWRFQDSNRKVSSDIDQGDCFLIQDRVISKGDHGKDFLESRNLFSSQADAVIKALKLSLNTPVYPKAIYSSYLSSFPLLPRTHIELAEFGGIRAEVKTPITRAEITAIKRNVRFINNSESQKPQEPGFFYTALAKFSDSFRGMHEKQSIVDLFIALEAMYGVSRGLRQQLATFTAFLLGTNDSKRQIFYDHVLAGYKLRNAIVHGSKNQKQAIYNALTDFFPELENKPTDEVVPYVSKATEELQRVVRLVLRAYVYMRYNKTREKWPSVDDLEYLPFDPTKRRLIQKQLGITAKQPAPPSWHF